MNHQVACCRAIVVVALWSALVVLPAASAAAAEKPKKVRGIIVKVDVENRSMVLSKPNSGKPDVTVEWIEGVEMKPGSKAVADLKEGVFVRCMINEEGKARTIRIYDEIPEEHRPKEE